MNKYSGHFFHYHTNLTSRVLFLAVLAGSLLKAQEFTWDANLSSTLPQNGTGTWNTTSTNWWDFNSGSNAAWINSTSSIANIGVVGGTSPSQSAISIAADIQLSQLNFRSISTTTPVSLHQYSLNGDLAGRVLDFGLNGLIQVEDFASGGSQFISLGSNLRLKGENLKIQKYGNGTAFQFLTLGMTANPELTGPFTLGGSIYAAFNPNTMPAVSQIVVEAGGSAAIGGVGLTYAVPFQLAGFGNSLTNSGTAYGAIRMTGTNSTYSGGFFLTSNAGVNTSSSGGFNASGITLSGPITDGGNNFEFHRFAFGGEGTLTLEAANTYGGATVLGRAANNYSGSVTILNFGAQMAPSNDILYHGVTLPGDVRFFGGTSPSVLRLVGASGQDNSQRLGNIRAGGTHASLEIISGEGGSVNVTTGMLTRDNSLVTLSVSNSGSGTVSTTGMAEGFVGPWMSYAGVDGQRSWATIKSGGVIGNGYTGEVEFLDGTELSDSIYGTSANLNLLGTSSGPVNSGVGISFLNTLSMSDWSNDRQIELATGQTLRLGATGGIQVLSGAGSLSIGVAGSGGGLSAGGSTLNATGTLFLGNHSTSSLLTIGANIVNNGSGAVAVVVNGAPGARTVLSGTNTHTGGTRVTGGLLEIRSNGALGTTGTVTVVEGTVASLGLGGGITLSRSLTIGGTGEGGLGSLRSLDGENRVSGLITIAGNSFISADAGATLNLLGATAASNVVTGTFALSLGGQGTINVGSRLNLGTGALTKVGNGLLTLGGDQIYTGATTVSAGTLQLMTGLVTTTSGMTVGANASLNLNGVELSRPLTLTGSGFSGNGAFYNNSATNSVVSNTVGLTVGVKVGGSGNITISNAGGVTGNVLLTKSGTGTLTVNASTTTSARSGANQIDSGILRVQSNATSGAFAPIGTGAYALNGGTLSLGYDVNNTTTNVVNLLADSTIIADRATVGAGSSVITLSTLTIGGNALTVRAGENVTSGTVGLTLGTVTIGGPSMLPGNPTFDVQSSVTAATTLRLGALTDQAIAPRSLTFQNSGTEPSTLVLGAASILVDGTQANIASAGGVLTLNIGAANALGTLTRVNLAGGNTLLLGASQTVASLSGSGNISAAAASTLTVGNSLSNESYNSSFSGVLANGATTLTLTKSGKGTLTLNGAISNTHTGLTTVNTGTLVLAKTDGATALGGSLTIGAAAASTAGKATVRLEGDGQMVIIASASDTNNLTINAGGVLDMNGHTLTVNTLVSFFGATISNSGTLVINRTGGTIGFTGVNTIGSTLQITTAGSGNATRTVSVTGVTDVITFAGPVTQSGSIVGTFNKTGNGTFVLSGDNTHSGVTTISGGIINIRHANALGTVASGTVVAAGGTLQIQGGITTSAEALTVTGTGFAGSNGIGYQTGALVNISGFNNYAGLLSLGTGGGTVSSDGGTLNLTHPGTITSAQLLTLAGAGDGSLTSVLGAAVTGVTKNGTGTWTLKGVNSSMGAISVNAGMLRLGDGVTGRYTSTPNLNFIGSGSFVFGGSTLASNQALGALTLMAGEGQLAVEAPVEGSNGLTFSALTAPAGGAGLNIVSPAGTTVSIIGAVDVNGIVDPRMFFNGADFASSDAGVIGAAASLPATESLTAGNTSPYLINSTFAQTGSVTVNAGLKFAGNSAYTLNDETLLTLNNGINRAGGILVTAGSSVVIGNQGAATGLTTGGAGDLVIRTDTINDSLAIEVPITSTTTGGLTKGGLGRLELKVANAYSGPTSVNAGTLIMGNPAALSTSVVTVQVGAVLDLNGQGASNAVVLHGAGTDGSGALLNNSGTTATIGALTIGLGNGTGGIGAVVGGSGDIVTMGVLTGNNMLVKSGAGVLTVGNNGGVAVPSTRSGLVRVDAGILRVNNSPSALGTVTSAVVLNGGALSLASTASIPAYPTSVTANSGIISDAFASGEGITHLMGVLALGNQTLLVSAGGNVTAEGTNAGITFGATTLLGSPTFDVQSPASSINGTTTLTLGALNDQGFAKTLNFVNNGTSTVNSVVTLAAGAGSLFEGTVVNINGGLHAGVTVNSNATTALGRFAEVTIGGNSRLNVGAAQILASLSGSGTVSASGAFVLTIGNADSALPLSTEFSGSLINGTGILGVTKSGLGTLTLTGANTYSGLTVVNGGVLVLGSASALGATSGVTVSAGSTLDLNGQTIDRNFTSIAGMGFEGRGAIINSSATTAVMNGTFVQGNHIKVGGSGNIFVSNAGGITGNATLTKMGGGTLTVTSVAASGRSGTNQIDEGTLRLEAATAIRTVGTGAMAMNGGTLSLGFDESGAVGGAVNLLSNSTIIIDRQSSGTGGITLTLGALTIAGNTLTIKPGENVTDGLIGLSLGTTSIGGPMMAPGNPVFDVQSSATATTVLTLGALSDQAIAPRTITFQNSGITPSAVTLATAAASLVPGTQVTLASTGGPLTLNVNLATSLGEWTNLTVGTGNTFSLGANVTLASLNGSGTVVSLVPAVLNIGNANSSVPVDSVFNGVLAGGQNLSYVKAGTGSLTLGGNSSNTFAGFTVTAGTLVLAKTGGAVAIPSNLVVGTPTGTNAQVRLMGADQIASSASLTLNPKSVFDMNGFNQSLGRLTGPEGGLVVNNATGTQAVLSLGNGGATGGIFGGMIADNTTGTGTMAVTKVGAGEVTLSGVNRFSGSLTITGGTLAFLKAESLGSGVISNSVLLNGGALKYIGTGGVDIGGARQIDIGPNGGIIDVSTATGVLTVSGGIDPASLGSLTKAGPGTLNLPGTTNMSGLDIIVTQGRMIAGFGQDGLGGISVGGGAVLDFGNGSTQALGGLSTLSLSSGARLGFELNGAENDSLAAIVAASVSGTILLDFTGIDAGIAAGTYNLISATGGLLGGNYVVGQGIAGWNLSIEKTDTLVSMTATQLQLLYWRGGQDASWNSVGDTFVNWTTDADGLVNTFRTPGFADTVVFSAANALFTSGSEIVTTVDAPFTINGLIFESRPTSITSVTLEAGSNGSINLGTLSATSGIEVKSNAGAIRIDVPLTVSGSQVWQVSGAGASLDVSGPVTFNNTVTKTGAGELTLSGENSSSGGLVITEGKLNINSPTALGTGRLTLAQGAVIDNTSGVPVSITTGNEITWSGSFAFAGTGDLDLGTGAVTLAGNVLLDTNSGSLAIGGPINSGSNVFGLGKTGSGTLTIVGSGNYLGSTVLDQGRLVFAADQSLAEPGNGLTLGAVSGSADSFTLDLTSASAYFGGDFIVQNNHSQANNVLIGAGKMLAIRGALNMGFSSLVSSTTRLTMTGGGIFKMGDVGAPTTGDVRIGNGSGDGRANASVLDMTELSEFYANLGATGTFRVGNDSTGSVVSDEGEGSSVILANTSTIQAGVISIDGSGSALHSIMLGSGVNTLNVGTLSVGGSSQSGRGLLAFGSASGSVVMRDLIGTGRADLMVQNGGSVSEGTLSGVVDFGGHSAELLLGTVTLGGRSGGTTGTGSGSLTFTDGFFDAITVNLAQRSGSTMTTGTVTGTLMLADLSQSTVVLIGALNMSRNSVSSATSSGGAESLVEIGGQGLVQIAALDMGLLSVSGAGATSGLSSLFSVSGGRTLVGTVQMAVNAAETSVMESTLAVSTLRVSGGVLSVAGAINMGGTSGNALNRTQNLIEIEGGGSLLVGGGISYAKGPGTEDMAVRLKGGSLDLMGSAIGSLTAPVSFVLESGTLKNAGEVNGGAGITKTTAGVVILDGDNQFSALTVAAGFVQLSSVGSLSGSAATLETDLVLVTGGGVLGGIGSITGDVTLSGTLEEPAILRPGLTGVQAGREILDINGVLTLGEYSRVEFVLGQTSFTALEVETLAFIDTTTRFGFSLESGYVPAPGASFQVMKWTAGSFNTLHDWSMNLDLPSADGFVWDVSDFSLLGIVRVVGDRQPPLITTPPLTQTVNAGAAVTLSVALSGSEAWLIQWMKDGMDIPGANGLSYTIPSSTTSDAGIYKVRVVNEFGTTESLGGTLSIRTMPVFNDQPEGGEAIDGQAFVFQVTVLGPPPLTYVWKKDGVAIDGAPSLPTYTLNPVRKSDHEGIYTVEVSNAFGMAESEPAELTVRILVPASITQEPEPVTVPEGNVATFNVVAEGDAPLTYQWRRNGVAITDGPDFIGTNTPTLQVRASLMTATASTYSVVVTGVGAPAVSQEAALTLGAVTVVITGNPLSQTVGLGAAVQLSVTSTGGLPQTFQWRRNGRALPGATGSTFTIPSASLASAGRYDCVASNNLATGRSSATSTAAEIVVVDDTPRRFVIRELSASPTLAVTAAGAGISYQWFFDLGAPGTPDFQPVSGATNRTFKPSALAAGERLFFCRVTGPGGSADGGLNQVLVYSAAPQIERTGDWVLPATTVSAPYSFRLPMAGQTVDPETGGEGAADPAKTAVTFRATGLPAGLSISSLGVISGRATVDGTFNVTLMATNALGSSSYGPVPLVVSPLGGNVIGQFAGLIDRSPALTGGLGGSVTLLTTKKGTYSGKATLGARTFAFKGILDPNPAGATASVVISRGKALPPLTLTFAVNNTTGLIERALSSITDATETASFGGWRQTWITARGAPPAAAKLAGYYTVGLTMDTALQGTSQNIGIPQGTGYASFTVAPATGTLTVAGRLADGTAFTTATFAGPNGEVLVFRTLYAANARGSVIGEFKINDGAHISSPDDNTLQGSLSWWRPVTPGTTARLYRAGFGPLDLTAVGGRYLPPLPTAANPRVMGLDATVPGVANAVVELTEARIEADKPLMTAPQPNTAEFRVDERNKALATDPANNLRAVTLSINAKTGAFTGRFSLRDVHPFSGGKPDPIIRTVTFQGLIVTGGAGPLGVGYYLLPQRPATVMEKATATPILSGRVVFDRP